jgi:hypothetical protein
VACGQTRVQRALACARRACVDGVGRALTEGLPQRGAAKAALEPLGKCSAPHWLQQLALPKAQPVTSAAASRVDSMCAGLGAGKGGAGPGGPPWRRRRRAARGLHGAHREKGMRRPQQRVAGQAGRRQLRRLARQAQAGRGGVVTRRGGGAAAAARGLRRARGGTAAGAALMLSAGRLRPSCRACCWTRASSRSHACAQLPSRIPPRRRPAAPGRAQRVEPVRGTLATASARARATPGVRRCYVVAARSAAAADCECERAGFGAGQRCPRVLWGAERGVMSEVERGAEASRLRLRQRCRR